MSSFPTSLSFTLLENSTFDWLNFRGAYISGSLKWSPNGSYLLWTVKEYPEIDGRITEVPHAYLYDLQTHQIQEVSSTLATGWVLSWSPNGRYLAVDLRDELNHHALIVVDVETGEETIIVDFAANQYFSPSYMVWLPEGWLQIGNATPTPTPTEPSTSCDFSPLNAAELVADISSANGTPEVDTICLAENTTYTLTTSNNGLNGLPLITSEIIVEGNGATLTRDEVAPNFRFFEVAPTGNLTLNNLTLSNGNTTGNQGGAIRNAGGVITLNEVIFNQNSSNTGGAIDSDSGIMTIHNSTFANNTAQYGGAIDNDAASTMLTKIGTGCQYCRA